MGPLGGGGSFGFAKTYKSSENTLAILLRTLGGVDLRAPDNREIRSVLAQPKRLALLVYLGDSLQWNTRQMFAHLAVVLVQPQRA